MCFYNFSIFFGCDSIPTSDTYDVLYKPGSVVYSNPAPSGKQLPGTTATITCKDGMFFPYSFTNTLRSLNTAAFTYSNSGSTKCYIQKYFWKQPKVKT